MALPKRRFSKARTAKRRSQIKVSVPALTRCSQCGESVVAHRICPSCGFYRGRQVLPMETARTPKEKQAAKAAS